MSKYIKTPTERKIEAIEQVWLKHYRDNVLQSKTDITKLTYAQTLRIVAAIKGHDFKVEREK